MYGMKLLASTAWQGEQLVAAAVEAGSVGLTLRIRKYTGSMRQAAYNTQLKTVQVCMCGVRVLVMHGADLG